MKNRYLIIMVAAAGVALTSRLQSKELSNSMPAPPAPAPGVSQPAGDNRASSTACLGISQILGKEVRSDSGEALGIVQDVIVDADSGSARFGILRYGGAFGLGGIRVAVPFKELKWSADAKAFSMAASKEKLELAAAVPQGGWTAVAGQSWVSRIDRFYGDPGPAELSATPAGRNLNGDNREYVRELVLPGAASKPGEKAPQTDAGSQAPLSKSSDSVLLTKITKLIGEHAGPGKGGDVQAAVENGIVTLKGKVSSVDQKEDLENSIKVINGVVSVNDEQLTATNE
jgi:sporulation protein YlmC with PRC-barrel domain